MRQEVNPGMMGYFANGHLVSRPQTTPCDWSQHPLNKQVKLGQFPLPVDVSSPAFSVQ